MFESLKYLPLLVILSAIGSVLVVVELVRAIIWAVHHISIRTY